MSLAIPAKPRSLKSLDGIVSIYRADTRSFNIFLCYCSPRDFSLRAFEDGLAGEERVVAASRLESIPQTPISCPESSSIETLCLTITTVKEIFEPSKRKLPVLKSSC
jgi:hypothetical protein